MPAVGQQLGLGSPRRRSALEGRGMDDGAEDEEAWTRAAEQVSEAYAHIEVGRASEGARLADEAAGVLLTCVGDAHPDFANALSAGGLARLALGDVAEALGLLARARSIYEPHRDELIVREMICELCGRWGDALARLGHFVESERLLVEGLGEAEQEPALSAEVRAAMAQALGVGLRFAGRYDDALLQYEHAADLYRATGAALPAVLLHNLAGLSSARGDDVAAEDYARAAVVLRGPDDSFALAQDLSGLGDALAGQSRFTEAEAAYRRALSVFEAVGRGDDVEVGFALHNLADMLAAAGRGAEAEQAYRSSLALKRAALGEKHFEVAATFNNLAALVYEAGRVAEARDLCQRSIAIVRDALPSSHPVRVACEALAARVCRG